MRLPLLFTAILLSVSPMMAAEVPPTDNTLTKELQPFLSADVWNNQETPVPTRQNLIDSVNAARKYFIAQQSKGGNFTYALDIATGDTSSDDNQVRQAGAIWGLACIHRDFPSDESREALIRAFAFVTENTRQITSGEYTFIYPGETSVKTGTIALLCLALTDFYDTPGLSQELHDQYKRMLFSFLAFLRSMEMEDGSWARAYEEPINFRDPEPSPYYDGEALLAYSYAAIRLNRKDLLKRINAVLPLLIRKYTVSAWGLDGNEELTKGFYQWGSMACEKYVAAQWTPHRQIAADAAIALAWWQIHKNQLETRKGNTGYAMEGLAASFNVARMTGNRQAAEKLETILKRHMGHLLLCQFHGPFMKLNPKFMALSAPAPDAAGGITDSPNNTIVRIDTVQHQIHAELMMLEYLYPESAK